MQPTRASNVNDTEQCSDMAHIDNETFYFELSSYVNFHNFVVDVKIIIRACFCFHEYVVE